MKRLFQIKKVLIIFLALLYTSGLFSQINEKKLIASLVYNIADYIIWPAKGETNEFVIGIFGKDTELLNEFELIAQKTNFKGKTIIIKECFNSLEIISTDLIYVCNDQNKVVPEIYLVARENSILLMTLQLENGIYSMINFTRDYAANKIDFEVNKQNLILAGFDYDPELLLYGGTELDIKELYKETQRLLEEENEKVISLQQENERRHQDIAELNEMIIQLEGNIESANDILLAMSDTISNKDTEIRQRSELLVDQNNEFNDMREQYKDLFLNFLIINDSIKSQRIRSEVLDKVIKDREKLIDQQLITINEQDSMLKARRRVGILSSLLSGTFLVIGLLILRAYRQKRKNNLLLELKVDERTKELKNTNTQLLTEIEERQKSEKELDNYRMNLEKLVEKRTEEIAVTNKELKSANDELHKQKDQLQVMLNSLNAAQDQLIQSEKMASLGILSAGIAHEINNPLNFVKGGLTFLEQYLKEKLKKDYGDAQPVIEAMNTGVNRAADIVKSLSLYSRSDSASETNCNVHDVIDDCLIILNNEIKNRIRIRKNYTDKKYMLLANEGKLHQAFLNILANASHAIEKKGQIIINSEIKNSHIEIDINDDGNGIAESEIGRIFDPFYTTKEPGKGTGLGLSITYNIIRELQGDIKVESAEGKGTKVMISIPVK